MAFPWRAHRARACILGRNFPAPFLFLSNESVKASTIQRNGPKAESARAKAPVSVSAPAASSLRSDPIVSLQSTVESLGYELVEVERLPRGLLRVSIDRIPGRAYAIPGEFVTVDDCELVTRQLQLVMEVESLSYERLEVSSPGLDRPLRRPADWLRFCGLQIEVTFKAPFQGQRKYRGLLCQAEPTPRLTFQQGKVEQVLDFTLEEVREARLVPVVDFKGRRQGARNGEQES